MPMLNDQQPQGLNDIFGGLSMLPGQMADEQSRRASMNSDLNQMGFLQDYTQNEAMNPLRVQNQQLTNQGLAGGLPGIFADSRSRTVKANVDEATQSSNIDKTNASNYKFKDDAEAEKVGQFGGMLGELATMAESGVMHPSIQGLPPEVQGMMRTPEGRKQLRAMSDDLIKRSASYQKAQMMQTFMDGREKEKTARALAVQQMRSQSAQAIASAKQQAVSSKDPTNLQGLATRYMQMANAETDQETKAELLQQANAAYQAYVEAGQAIRAAGDPSAVDPSAATGLPRKGPPKVPTMPVPPPKAATGTPKFVGKDMDAYNWAMANKNDPRSKTILQKLGVQ
jgi:hypothetical protein